MRTISFSFDDKVLALALIQAVGSKAATRVLSRAHKFAAPPMREYIDDMNTHNFLIGDGVIEITKTGVLQYTQFTCPQQPSVLTQELFETLHPTTQKDMEEAFAFIGVVLRSFKPYVRKPAPTKQLNTAPAVSVNA